MVDFLDILALEAQERLSDGYYKVQEMYSSGNRSLVAAIRKRPGNSIIAELKPASPSAGPLRKDLDVSECAKAMERGGAAGLSVLTVPQRFNGHLSSIPLAKSAAGLPVLMKDFVISREQVRAAANVGADCLLLIFSLFQRGYVDNDLESMIAHAHDMGLEVLLETHDEDEFCAAFGTPADIIGINNRDLRSLSVDFDVTRRLLSGGRPDNRLVATESGINSSVDIASLKNAGADAFLIGSAIMSSEDIEATVRRFSEGR